MRALRAACAMAAPAVNGSPERILPGLLLRLHSLLRKIVHCRLRVGRWWWRCRLRRRHLRTLCGCTRRHLVSPCRTHLIQGFPVDLRMGGLGDAVLIAQLIGMNLLRWLLQIFRQGQVGRFLGPCQIRGAQQVRLRPVRHPLGREDHQQHQNNVDNDRDPESFALSRTRQLILELCQQVRHKLRILILHGQQRPPRRSRRLRRRIGWRRRYLIVALGLDLGTPLKSVNNLDETSVRGAGSGSPAHGLTSPSCVQPASVPNDFRIWPGIRAG